MAKSNSISKLSDFKFCVKRYFSSLSARGDKFIYCNLPNHKDLIVVTNGDYILLEKYQPVLLSIHILRFKNNFKNELLSKLGISNEEKPYILRSQILTQTIRDNKLEDVSVIRDDEDSIKFKIGDVVVEDDDNTDGNNGDDFDDDEDELLQTKEYVDKEENPFDEEYVEEKKVIFSSDIVGKVADDQFTLFKLEEYLDEILDNYNSITENKYNIIEYEFNSIPYGYLLGNIFRSAEIKGINPDKIDCYCVYTDGMNGPSIKEFINKSTEFNSKSKLFVWSDNDDKILKNLVVYQDETVDIISCKPNSEMVWIGKDKIRL